jgi:hypothetical protein
MRRKEATPDLIATVSKINKKKRQMSKELKKWEVGL